jgi:hypothetical protein
MLDEVASSTIMRLPGQVSGRLPSRGQVAVVGTLNGHEFATVVEPDGVKGHWIRVDQQLQRTAGLRTGESVPAVGRQLRRASFDPDSCVGTGGFG